MVSCHVYIKIILTARQ